GEPGTIEEQRAKNGQSHRLVAGVDYDLEQEILELQPIIEDMYRRGILSDSWDGEEEDEDR
ncbi:MAG: hypothetical protein ACRDTR_10270, partial [Rubrobacter sp.]